MGTSAAMKGYKRYVGKEVGASKEAVKLHWAMKEDASVHGVVISSCLCALSVS